LNISGLFRHCFSRLFNRFVTLARHVRIVVLQTLGQLDQGELRLRLALPEVVVFPQLDQGGCPGFQLDFGGSVLVFSQSLDEMTQTQSFDAFEVDLPIALAVDCDEIHQVGGRGVAQASENLVGGDGHGFHSGSDGCANFTTF
jgi:hypothetical protein